MVKINWWPKTAGEKAEALIIAAHNQSLRSRNYQENIIKKQIKHKM